jgi:hypothetical protein
MSATVVTISNDIPSLPDKLNRAIKRGMNQWSEETMTLAKERAPVDEGTLRASGFVEPAEGAGNVITQALGFGGAASAYALIQHERLDFHHNVGQAKFLESAALDREHELKTTIEQEIASEIG